MIKREVKYNLKSFIIWASIFVLMYVLVFLIYPSMSSNISAFEELMKVFPPKMLEMFNMDIMNLGSVFGWISTEGFMMLTLIGSCYFTIMGSSIILKEQYEGTIEFLYSKPITRNKMVFTKLITGFVFIIAFNIIIFLTSLIGLLLCGNLDFTKLILLSKLPVLIHLFFFSVSFFLSLFFNKTNKSIGINLGLLFGFYFINTISSISDKVEFLKYFTPFYYIDARSVLVDNKIEITNIFIMILVFILLQILIFRKFNKKELI